MTRGGHRPADQDEARAPLDLRLVPAALGLWAGCVAGLLGGTPNWAAAVSVLVVAVAGPVLPLRLRAGVLACVAMTLVGCLLATLARRAADADPALTAARDGSYAQIEATVRAPPQPVRSAFGPGTVEQDSGGARDARYRILGDLDVVEVAGTATTSRVGVSIVGSGPGWAAVTVGSRVAVGGLLAVDDYALLPGVELRARTEPTLLMGPPWWYRVTTVVRNDLRRSAAALAPDPAGLLPGLVVGDTSGIPRELDADAKTTGLTHLLAVSGSHFAILCGMVVLVLRRWGPRAGVLGGAVTLVALVLLVGPQPSVMRAAVMGTVGLIAVLLGRVRTAVPALCTAVVVLLLIDPSLSLSFGFALSVLATAGLVFLAPTWVTALRRRGVPRGWAEFVTVPVAAQLTTMPVVVALSGQVSLAAVPANLVVAPVVPAALVLGVLAAVVGPVWPPGGVGLARMNEPLLTWISGTAHLLASQSGAAVPWPATAGGVLILAGMLIAMLMLLRHRRIRALVVAVLGGALAVLLPARVIALPGWPAAHWLLTACDVGQGDAMVLATDEPDVAVLVDTGPDPGLVDGCLDDLGIGTIALLVLTHLHADHIDGLAGVLDGRSVGVIGVGPETDPAPALDQVRRIAAARGVPVVPLEVGSRWSAGGLGLDVLAPRQVFHGTDSDPNNDSVVLMAQRHGVRILMTGDIETEAQQQLLDSGIDLHADVLKVPHHGSSKDLPAFLAAVSPDVAVIGVGKDNDYGHPSPRTLDELRRVGTAVILRTDTDGDVAVGVVDGQLTTTIRGP